MHEDVKEYCKELIKTIDSFTIEQIDDFRELCDVNVYVFKEFDKRSDKNPYSYLLFSFSIEKLTEMKHRIGYEGYNHLFYFDWAKRALKDSLNTFLQSDYFRNEQEIAENIIKQNSNWLQPSNSLNNHWDLKRRTDDIIENLIKLERVSEATQLKEMVKNIYDNPNEYSARMIELKTFLNRLF